MTSLNPSRFAPSSVAHSSRSSSARMAISPRTAYSASMTAGLMVSFVRTRSEEDVRAPPLLFALLLLLLDEGVVAPVESCRR